MKGLLIKDILNFKKQWLVMLFLLIFYSVFAVLNDSPEMVGFMMVLLSLILPMTAFAYDEQSKWDRYALSMPVSRTEIVLSRYLFLLLLVVLLSLFAFFLNFCMGVAPGEAFSSTALFSALSLLMGAVSFPVLFRFGPEKTRLLMVLVILIPTVGLMLLERAGLLPEELPAFGDLLPFFLPAALLLFVLSFFLSVQIYKRKEF